MIRAKKVLILYASYGDGHRQVAAALEQSFQARGMQTVALDLYKESHPMLNAFVRYFYMNSFSHWTSQIYGWSYYWTRELGPIDGRARHLFSLGMQTLKEMIKMVQPDAIVNTFPFMAMPAVVRNLGKQILTYAAITDFGLHDLWVHPAIDKYFVATTDLKTSLEQKGIPGDQIRVTGIPLRHSFTTGDPNSVDLQKMGLDPSKKTILIMAGAFGVLRNTRSLCASLLRIEDTQLVVVCGKNERRKMQLESHFCEEAHIKILGYVENIAGLMAVSHCMVTKAGGITLSEAISIGIPPLVFCPVPGQEKENAVYLANKGAAIVANHPEEAAGKVRKLLHDKRQARQMKQALRSLKQLDATEAVVSDIALDLALSHESFRKSVDKLPSSFEMVHL